MTNRTHSHLVAIAGNVYFCKFDGARPAAAPDAELAQMAARDIRRMAETLQSACRDLIAGAPALVRRAELNAADLVSIASMIDELAFHAHVMALDSVDVDAVAIRPPDLQQLLMDGASVTAEIQSCMSEVNLAAEHMLQRLHRQTGRAQQLGRNIAAALEAAAREAQDDKPKNKPAHPAGS